MALAYRPVAAIPSIRYVKGLTRYMNSQKPGSACGGCMTPLNISIILKRRVAMLPAVAESCRAAMRACAKVDANMKNWMLHSRIRP